MSLSSIPRAFRGLTDGYAAILRAPGRTRFLIAGWFGRFPKSSLGLATVLMVALSTGSYALAGGVSASFVLALALGGPQWSRAMDRLGQRRVIAIGAASLTVFALLLLTAVLADWPVWSWFVLAALAGASVVDMGSVARSRWNVLEPEGRRHHSAFALESISDELVFVVSPPLVTVLAALVHPALGFLTGLVIGLAGSVLMLAQPTTDARPPLTVAARRRFGPPMTTLGIVLAFAGLGGIFGSLDVATVALVEAAGVPAMAGVIIGVFSLASVLSGLVLGARSLPGTERGRFLIAVLALALVVPLFALASGVGAAVLIAALAGIVISPVMITGLTLVSRRAERDRLTETLAYPTAGLAIGGTAGALLGGVTVDAAGAQAGYLVTACAAVFAALSASIWELTAVRAPRAAAAGERAGSVAVAAPDPEDSAGRQRRALR